jgi:hypothetical protein
MARPGGGIHDDHDERIGHGQHDDGDAPLAAVESPAGSMRDRRFLLVLAALVLAGCGTIQEARQVANPAVAGEVVIRTPSGEPVTWTPAFCQTGEIEQFFGFVLGASDSPVVLRAVLDPLDGPGLRVTGVEGTPPYGFVVHPADCRVLDLRVQPTRWRVNEMRDVSGSLDVSCSLGDLSLEGSVEVSHCH